MKGLDLLFKAIKTDANILRRNKCHFDLYGPDILGRLDQVRQLVQENGIEDLVSIYTEISGIEKEEKLLDADIFIQTSRHEGMPMGILEAMSYGIPCLITEGTSLAERVEKFDAGWNAGRLNDDIANAIKKLFEECDSLSTKSKNARLLISREFAWSIIARNTLEQYKKLLSEMKG